MTRAPVSLNVLTYNEDVHVLHTLENVKDWIGEIIIVDSSSTDKTLEICRQYTDKIYQHPFENQAAQFNWALDHLPIGHDWVMRLDADELVTPALAMEICRVVPTLPDDVSGIYLKRRIHFMGRWMRHGGLYPMWFLRIFRKEQGRYEEITEEHIVLRRGRAIRLENDFIDENRKGLTFWTDKHNHWAIGEMLDLMALRGWGSLPQETVSPALFATQERRRRWLKRNVYARAPLFGRAFAYAFYRYVLRGGFLDGREGLIFHFLQGCWYRFFVDAKIYEARRFGLREAETARGYSASKPWATRTDENAGG